MQGIFRFTLQNYRAELILVNNGSSDNTKGQIDGKLKIINRKSVIKLVNLNFNKVMESILKV